MILWRVMPLETPFGLLIRFIYNLTHVTTITHNISYAVSHYTAYNLTFYYSILFSHRLHNTLHIFTYSHFPCLSPIENLLFELLKTELKLLTPSLI
jgi:ABC-type uncharacterized transport system permease subunit